MNKRILLFLFASSLMINATNVQAAVEGKDMGKIAAALFGSGVLFYATGKVADSNIVKRSCNKLTLNSKDVARVISLSGSLLALSLVAEQSNAKALQEYAWRVPVAGGVTAITTTKTFNNIVEKIPFIGEHLVCKDPDCQGSCRNCVLTMGIKAIGAYQIIKYGAPLVLGLFATK